MIIQYSNHQVFGMSSNSSSSSTTTTITSVLSKHKLAIGLCGQYSSLWKLNQALYENDDIDVDIYMVSLTDHSDILTYATASEVIRPDIVNRMQDINERFKPDWLRSELVCQVQSLIESNIAHLEHNPYKQIIITTFRTVILELPPVSLVTTTTGSNSDNCVEEIYDYTMFCNHDEKQQPYIHLISDVAYRNGYDPVYLHHAEIPLRRQIFKALYNDRVIDADVWIPTKQVQFTQHIFCIPSVIHCTQKEFDYDTFKSRSVFTGKERFTQLLQQIQSLNTIVPNSHIYILEGSSLTWTQMAALARYPNVTTILFQRHIQGNHYANLHPNKSLYELWLMQWMLERLEGKYDILFKFGGRYSLTSMFDISIYDTSDAIVIRTHKNTHGYTDKEIMECILYGFPSRLHNNMITIYDNTRNHIENNGSGSTEELLFQEIEKHIGYENIHRIEHCCVTSWDAVYGFDKLV